MRLFLSSYRAGNYQNELVNLFGRGAKVALITNPKDYKTELEYKESVTEVVDFLKNLGFKVTKIDLRKYFEKVNFTKEDLKTFQAIWMPGGNTFVLRRALKYSGADKIIREMVGKDEIIYGGESAGAILPTPTLTGVQFGDDLNVVPAGYQKEVIWEGLNLIPYHVVPHYQSEWEGAEDMIKALKKKKHTYRTITNDQAIIIDGDREEFLA